MTLTEFLTARLDEDEHWAHMAEAGWPPVNGLAAAREPEHYPFMATDITPSKATFIEAHPPARVLREADAKRKILALHYPVVEDYKDGDGIDRSSYECAECQPPGTPDNWPCPTVRALAAVWSDHPDYNPDWSR